MSFSSSSNDFETGNYMTELHSVEARKSAIPIPPPIPLLIGMPSSAGEFPLLLFLHGYLLYNSFYSQLIQHVASHGFIVIAPQVCFALYYPFSQFHGLQFLIQLYDIAYGFYFISV